MDINLRLHLACMGNDPEYTTVRVKRMTAQALKFGREREPYESIIASLLELKRPSLESEGTTHA